MRILRPSLRLAAALVATALLLSFAPAVTDAATTGTLNAQIPIKGVDGWWSGTVTITCNLFNGTVTGFRGGAENATAAQVTSYPSQTDTIHVGPGNGDYKTVTVTWQNYDFSAARTVWCTEAGGGSDGIDLGNSVRNGSASIPTKTAADLKSSPSYTVTTSTIILSWKPHGGRNH
jgi:hypothetical protein